MLPERHGSSTVLLSKFYYLFVFLLVCGQLAVAGKFSGGKIYYYDIFLTIFVIFGLTYFLSIKKRLYVPKYLTFFFIFTFIALISLVPFYAAASFEEFLFASSYLVKWTLYLLLALLTLNMLKEKIITRSKAINSVILSGIFLSVAGFVQLIILPDFTVLDPSLGWDPHMNRLASTFFDPNFTGIYLVLVLALFLFKKEFFEVDKDIKSSLLGSKYSHLIFAVMFIALFLTYSRSSWAAFGVLLFIYGIIYSGKLIFISFLVAFLAYFAVPRIQTRLAGITDPSDSAHYRLISWKNTLDIASDNLFLGVGYNSFKYSQIEYGFLDPDTQKEHSSTGSDSSFLLVLATTGIFGLVSFAVGMFFPAFSLATGKKGYFLLGITGSLLLHSQFVNSLFYPQIMFLWMGYFALIESFSHK